MMQMWNPWEMYDRLIEDIDPAVTVRSAGIDGTWCRVPTSEGGAGMAFHMPVESMPRSMEGSLKGRSLRDVAACAKSWNFVEAGIGMAAINSWYALPERAEAHGFTPCEQNNWQNLFDPWAQRSAGARVAVIGHFPFAASALPNVSELLILERIVQPGDYPDSACEYVLPTCDYVFISGSAFVNKTMPRLLELSRDATTIVVGPSTPATPLLLEYGVDHLTTFSTQQAPLLEQALAGQLMGGMYEAGRRIELSA